MTDLETGLAETASLTAGPYVHIGCTPVYTGIQSYRDETDLGSSMINDETKGQRIRIFGTILDGRNDVVKDGLAEIWHADHAGLYAAMDGFGRCPDPNFSFCGRQTTDHETGAFEFRTIRPGRVPLADGKLQAPHVNAGSEGDYEFNICLQGEMESVLFDV